MADIYLRLTLKPLLIHLEVRTQKLHIDFGGKSRNRKCISKPPSDEVRKLFTEIGCIMEDASHAALIWRDGDGLDLRVRLQILSRAHKEIGNLLSRFDSTS